MQTNSQLKESRKLTDAQMREFIVNGHLTIKADLPRSFHETIYRKTQETHGERGKFREQHLAARSRTTGYF